MTDATVMTPSDDETPGTDTPADEAPTEDTPLSHVPPEIEEAARIAPDHWFGMVDPAWRGDSSPPNWAVVGQYRSDTEGKVVEWQYNDDYRPSPSANGWPEPTDPVDEAIQLAATGYGPEDDVYRLLADAEVGVLLAPDGSPLRVCVPDGRPAVPVFSSEAQLLAGGRYAARRLPVQELLPELDEETQLYVNPTGAVSMTVDPGLVTVTDEQPADRPAAEEVAVGTAEDTAEPVPVARDAEPDDAEPTVGGPTQRPGVLQVETVHLPEPEPEPEPEARPEPIKADAHTSGPEPKRSEEPAPGASRNQLVNILNGLDG
ncbi:type VII secretion system-associated protein [Streptomyces sp. NPDC046988]|uniref:type VII secretion system-associated protein n=1 Tax=Streptomyces sp. NPDC046988 TaxID=3154922 RepID=UPI0033FF1CC3